jgi:hypothetical protein
MAERAGVCVGPYTSNYPNKKSLLFRCSRIHARKLLLGAGGWGVAKTPFCADSREIFNISIEARSRAYDD